MYPENTSAITKAMPDAEQLIGLIDDVVCSINEAGLFVYVSPAVERLFGYAPEALHGTALCELVRPAHRAGISAVLHSSQQGPVEVAADVRCANNKYIPTTWRFCRQEEQPQWYCLVRKAQVRFSDDRQLKMQDIAGVAYFEFDIASGQYSYLSDNFYHLCGISRREYPVVTGELFWSLVHPEDRSRVQSEMLHTNRVTAKCQHHYRIVRPDGTLIYLNHNREICYNADGKHYKTVGTFQDVTLLKRSQLALEQSEKRFRALAAGGSDMVAVMSADGVYSYVGDSILPLLGYHPSEMVGKAVFEFLHPDDHAVALSHLSQIDSRNFVQVPPIRVRNRSGEWRWLESRVTNMLDDACIAGLVVNSRDVTAQKAVDDRLREFSLIVEEAEQAIMIIDTNHLVTWANKATCRMSGLPIDEVVGRQPFEVFAVEGLDEAMYLRMWQHLQGGNTLQQQVLCFAKDGTPAWVNVHIQPMYDPEGAIKHYLLMGKDVSEHRRAETELQLSEQRFRALVQEGSDLIVIVNEYGLFTYSSDSLLKVLGYTPDEILHKSLMDFIHPADAALTLEGIERVRTNTTQGGVRHRFRHKNGSFVWLESKGTNHYHHPLIKGMIVNARDITDQVLLQQQLDTELRSKQKEITAAVIKAQESERSIMGLELHDNVSQVLTTIKLYVEMYLSGYKDDRNLLERSTKYLQDCINEIRNISKRLSAPTLGRITLKDSISDLVNSVNLAHKLYINFSAKGVEHLYIAEDLHLSIYRIIQEGLNNIIKYAQATCVEVSISYQQNRLSLVIEDNGKGFDTKAKHGGIGITNMKTRAENMNGTFSLYSTQGKGCTIKVDFNLP